MQKLNIITVEDQKGGFTGFLKDRPNIVAESKSHAEVAENLLNLVKAVDADEKNKEKEKN